VSGTLFVVATPIGNLEDITLRALRVLKEVDVIACEDTRRTRALLSHFDIHTPTVSYFEHNKLARGPQLLRQLAEGRSIALVTDAGTPGISDPGFMLVRDARAAGIPVVPVPGPAAVAAVLSAAGIPADRFVFDGFLPIKPGRRVNRLTALRELETTIVLYESPHRILATLEARNRRRARAHQAVRGDRAGDRRGPSRAAGGGGCARRVHGGNSRRVNPAYTA
jgi:16S rRNA (cytidine1402-2'-O)-methyltransferase